MPRPTLRGNVYRRNDSSVLWLWYRDAAGKRRHVPTELMPGQERQARALLDEVLRQVDAGETPAAAPGSTAALIERWLADRTARGKRSAAHEAARLRMYVVPRLGSIPADELRPSDVRRLVRELEQLPSSRGGKLATRTVLHVFRTLRQVFSEAVADELLERNPVVLKRADLPTKMDKDPAWRAGAQFTAAEVGALLADPRVPEDRRVLYAIEFLGGLRTGEAAARRWRDWDATSAPLGGLVVATSYDTRTGEEVPTKTKRPRRVPVHPVTVELLRRWKSGGWARAYGRAPGPEDLIVPDAAGEFRSAATSWKRWAEDLETLGLRHRRHYDSRRTFISLGLAGGARKDVLRWITHAPGDVFDEYTTLPWATLCEAVACLRVELRPAGVEPLRVVAGGEGSVTLAVTFDSERTHESGSFPRNVAAMSRGRIDGRTGESNPPTAPLSTIHRF